jgi:hypothetical protein
VDGKFAIVGCSAGTQCFALPLVNKQGTTITCATQKDAEERISNTGATGGITGEGNDSPNKSTPAPPPAPPPTSSSNPAPSQTLSKSPAVLVANTQPAPTPTSSSKPAPSQTPSASFILQNGLDAQKENAEASTRNADSPCKEGEATCVGSAFGQCVGGKFVLTPCPATLECFVLPLLKKAGTAPSCTTQAEAATRIANSGAEGGIQGSN